MQDRKQVFENLKKVTSDAKDNKKSLNFDDNNDKDKIDSDYDYDEDFEDDQEETRKKEKILKEIQDKKIVRNYEEQKAKGTLKITDEPSEGREKSQEDQELDNLWQRIRNFLNDLNEKGEKKEVRGKATRERLLQDFEENDYSKKGTLAAIFVQMAFKSARFTPMPSSDLMMKLFKALEIVSGEDYINYRELLAAPVNREFYSINGIFPKIKAKGPTQKQIEEQKRKEEEEKKIKLKEEQEENKRKELHDKRLEEMRKSGQNQFKKITKEDEKMKQREEELKNQKEQRELLRKQQEETEKVKKEVSEYRKAIEQLQIAAKKSGENLRNWFKLSDENQDGNLDIDELRKLLKYAQISVREIDLVKVFELMDLRQCGKISYNDFCDVIDKNQTLSIEQIVRKRRLERGEEYIEGEKEEEDDKVTIKSNLKTMYGDFGSSQNNKDIGNVDGLSSIMKRSAFDQNESRQFIDDGDAINLYQEIKELFKTNAFNFEDLLSKMAKPEISKENMVIFKDFEKLVKSMPGASRYSTLQLRQVFSTYSQDSQGYPRETYIPLKVFKDKFYPGVQWQHDNLSSNINSSYLRSQDSKSVSGIESKSESMHIDNVLSGRRYEDLQKDKGLEKERLLKQKEQKYSVGRYGKQDNLFVIREDKHEIESQSSLPSRAIDDMMYKQDYEPRKTKKLANQINNDKSNLYLDKEQSYKINQDFYRQNEVISKQMPIQDKFTFDRSLDIFFKKFCKALMDEISSGPVKRDISSYVGHYGKETTGFLSYQEFREIYLNHVHYVENNAQKTFNEEAKLKALFGIFDSQSFGRISQNDFIKIILGQQPANTLIERLRNKIKKGGDRLIRVLSEEFQEADIPYGCNGQLPISNFQTIMIDYDLPLLEFDRQDLKKKALIHTDLIDNQYIKYKELLDLASPKKAVTLEMTELNKLITKVQAVWKGYLTRKMYSNANQQDFKAASKALGTFSNRNKGVTFKDGQDEQKLKQVNIKKQTKQEEEKKKKQMTQNTKMKKKKADTLESRMGQVIKPQKETKLSEKQLQIRKDISEYIKNTVLENIITATICYGESLEIGRDIQKKFENRPVTKFVYPLMQEFQFNVIGVQPKSLQTLNDLGQVMFLDSESYLNQYDITTNKTLQQVNLGTRPPLKHYDIIDMVCDQTSGRIYTLNSNWILEIWNIEQNASLPQKRLAVCTNEGNKDYISIYYKNTFNNSKPRFLSLSDHNSQILIVNTSCIDGCIVFIDPISFSVLKKIQLRYQDYEISKKVRDCIKQLKTIFKRIIDQSHKLASDIFSGIINKDTQNIQIREFVSKISSLDKTIKQEELYKLCQVLDSDNNGMISMDEFLHYFQYLEQDDETEFEKRKAEEELQENIWPEWIVKSGQTDYAKNLLGKMFDVLINKHGVTAEQAFGIYDMKDKGVISLDEFQRILKIFFTEILANQNDMDFIIKMTTKAADQKIFYKDFCKFLDKRFIRNFKNANTSMSMSVSDEKDSQYLKELDNLLKKEASINYIIRKIAELNLDLRAILLKNDENQLSVIPRTRFWRILESLPLGLLSFEIEEIFESDLHFDNYGNVDYTVILNSDMFVALERKRLRRLNQNKKTDEKQDESREDMDKMTDNRKVVVEDLIYIDDLEMLIYTTIIPKTSTIFITHAKKLQLLESSKKAEVINLQSLSKQEKENEKEIIPNYYQLLARLRGHRNTDPPTLCYVPSSGCLISGEKHLSEIAVKTSKDSFPKIDDPNIPVSHKFQKNNQSSYEKHANRENQYNYKSEIIIWNLQRDMIELFQANPPWNVPIFKRFDAHNSSIIDICYMPKAQLLVSASTDQTIRFFDPVSVSHELTDPSNIPHVTQKPGYYKPLEKELTKDNVTFKEVKRIYTAPDTSCFAIRCINIQGIYLDPNSPNFKSQIEWIITLKLGRPQHQGRKNTQLGFICGYGLERMKIEVPAIHHDDVIPPHVSKECEDLISTRRRRIVTAFQHQLSHKIEKIYSQVQLQNSYIEQIRKLFLQAILQRKDIKYVNPEPLREIYKIILKLPNRTKFENFLATTGCKDKLSVSETFFYLQIFMQIHPLRTTQIEFEKSIEEFQQKHSREFLRGAKRWPKQSIQKFANYIRINGLNLSYLQRDSFTPNQTKQNQFCTRERFIQYFQEEIKPKQGFSDEEIDTILNELDPFFTGIIQIDLIQNYYKEEIHFYSITTLNRPKQIFSDIRGKVFPNKKLALQQALTSVDIQGDGFIMHEQFIEAFQKAQIQIDREVLEFLFNVVAEKFNTTQQEGTTTNSEEKVLSITYFINKLFNQPETMELNEIDLLLQDLKAIMIYKGLDFSIIFAENTLEAQKTNKSSALDKSQNDDALIKLEKQNNQPIDLTQHCTRFSQQLVKEEFCQRLETLNCRSISQDKIKKLANFLSLNQKNASIIYLNCWLHHLRRVQTAFHQADKTILPMICSKLLRNESVFRSYIESTADLKGKREVEKIIDVADLRQVLHIFGVNYINQNIFVTEFTRNENIHIEDLITRMKNCVKQAYNMATSNLNKSVSSDNIQINEIETLRDLKQTDYFDKIQMRLKNLGTSIRLSELIDKMKQFDLGNAGKIKIYHFINVLKHNYSQLFDNEILIGLQFELECINSDNCVDYEEFVKIFLEKQVMEGRDNVISQEVKLDKRSTYQIQDYEDLLSKISMHIKHEGLDMMRIFKIFSKNGFISYEHLRKIFDLIEFKLTDTDYKLLVTFADVNNDGNISSFEFANSIIFAREIAPQFDINKWIVASRVLNGRFYLLEKILLQMDMIKDSLIIEQGENGQHSGILTGEQFQNIIRDLQLGLTEYDIDLLAMYAIKGSKRVQSGENSDQQVNVRNDLIQLYNFEKSLTPVIKHMRKEDTERQRREKEYDQFEEGMQRFRKEIKQRKEDEKDQYQKMDQAQQTRETQLINKIIDIFLERDITFFDCFQHQYDPLNPKQNAIPISQFKKSINCLNLPLTVQEHRILRRIADPKQIGKVDLQKFCVKFETEELRIKRLNDILEKVAVSFYLQNFNLRRAFALFDRDGDGEISQREFRQGWLALNLGLTYDEIDDLMKIVDTSKSNSISYDEFISKMDVHIQRKSSQAAEEAETIIFQKLKHLIDANQKSLYEIMMDYEYDNSGRIAKSDLIRVFKRLGVLHPEPYLTSLIRAGGANETDETIDFVIYSEKLLKHIDTILKYNVEQSTIFMQKLFAIIQTKKLSIFEFFCVLDVNMSGKISKLEFKTGIQSFGLSITVKEFDSLWKILKKQSKKLNLKKERDDQSPSSRRQKKDDQEIEIEHLSYYDVVNGFITCNCIKLSQTVDNTNNLVNKFRQQLKKKNMSVEKLYKQLDPQDRKYVFRNDFVNECLIGGFEFTDEELEKIFDYICKVGSKPIDSNDQQKQQVERSIQKATTRFTFKQLHDAILVKRDENWLGIVLQKNVTYKRLFTSWREKNSKAQQGRLSSKELKTGLKKLRAGLTTDEIDKLLTSIPFEGKDNAISAQEFEKIVVQGAKKLEQEKSYEKLLLQEWITVFNHTLQKTSAPMDRVFQEHDKEQKGSLSFEEFVNMNEFIGVPLTKKDLKRIFDIIDRVKQGRIRMEDVKSIVSLLDNDEIDEENALIMQEEEKRQVLEGEALKVRQELDDLYEQIKEKLEKKNITFENVVYDQLKYLPNQFANNKGIQQVLEKIQIIVSHKEAQKILDDVRQTFNGRFECSFKDFIDFLTRKRINVAFFDKGFVDPLIAQSCQQLVKSISNYDLTIEQCFDILDKNRDGFIPKEEFLKCIQCMNLGIALEDLIEFFNYIDDKNENTVSRLQFVDAVTFVTNKIGGGSKLEYALNVGIQQTKKGSSLRQMVFIILKKISEAIQVKRYSMRQVISIFDQNKTGFISRAEFANIVKNLEGGISLEQTRILMTFFDEKNTGKISVVEFVKSIQEILNQQTGGGVYAFMQIQPTLQRIINELSIDSDKFFDEIADLNEQYIDEEIKQRNSMRGFSQRAQKQVKGSLIGLNKRLFYQHLQKYGVQLDEDEKTLFNSVFGLPDYMEKFDYQKLDTAFEGVQQQQYAQEIYYTVEWERRIFKKIGDYLKKNNLTIHQCFNLIDEDKSQTVSIDELRQAIIRFQINISDKELKTFMQRLDENNKGYITQSHFIKRFWSAYTYDDVFNMDQEVSKEGVINGQLSDKIKRIKMFNAIQKKMKATHNCNDAFNKFDSGIGLLTFKDVQIKLPQYFDIILKREDVTQLFKEIDSDKDGIIKLKEFELFYKEDYDKRLKEIEKRQEHVNMQFELFDHLIKVLEQKSLTLAEVFKQIDMNQNGFIECDEFQNLLERMGFTVSEQQVYELMRQMDENFDGRISYSELEKHIRQLGFQIGSSQEIHDGKKKKNIQELFVWRDKGLELVIRLLNDNLDKKPFEEFFKKFDQDHDNYLTPYEFRTALLSMKDSQLKKQQIERILHVVIDEKKSTALISINKISKFFKSYKFLEKQSGNSSSILINEDLFVYIVEKYDGFSRLVDQISQLEEKSSYIQRHVHELRLRSFNLLGNQKAVEKLYKKNANLNELFQQTFILLAGEASRLMKEEAQLVGLDPSYNINTIVNDSNVGVLSSVDIPIIENSAIDIDFTTLTYLPSGAQRYQGVMPQTKQKIEVLIFPNEELNYVSLDGKTYKKHLQMELQVHRYLMGAHFEDDQDLNPDKMHIFSNIGKFEKKIGLAASDKEIYVINESINEDEWISLDDFVEKNGGILNIPLFYHTDAPLYIIRHWAQKILQIIQKLHDVSIILRCLDLKQIYVSRDGQRFKIANVRGIGKVNNLGNISSCPDIYLTLDNNIIDDKFGQSSTISPGFHAGTSSKKTDTQKTFSNRALDNSFIAPETLFTKFSDQTSALDVWSFGMIMYCLLLGQKPASFYSIYRSWYKKQHGHDIELSSLPFIPPSQTNFIYDPFSIDLDNPFNDEDLQLNDDLNIPGTLQEKKGTLNFENSMKCIKNLSYSSLFADGNSKKFQFKTVAQEIKDNNNPNAIQNQPPKFPGQAKTNAQLRRKVMQSFAKAEILDRKNELGLILDIVSSCLDLDPKKRPTIQGLLHSPLFILDNYELTNAVRFSQNVILYRSPISSVSMRITGPLRAMCTIGIKNPDLLFEIEPDILKMFAFTEECINHISTLPIDQINDVLTEDEKRRGLMITSNQSLMKTKYYSTLRVSPNSPLAAQIIEDKVIDMLLFLTLRYFKGFNKWKEMKIKQIAKETQSILKQQQSLSMSSKRKSVKFAEDDSSERQQQFQQMNQQQLFKKQTERLQNQILQRMCNLLKTLVYEMHSYSTPMAPYVKEILEYIVKLFVGEEYELGSDFVLRKTTGIDSTLKDYLRSRSFFRREVELTEKFKSDNTDKAWFTEQKNKVFLDKSNYWDTDLYKEVFKIYKDAITESGMGQSCYPVINDYITNITNSFEPSKVFSKQMNQLCLSFLIPMNRTIAYYNEMIPLTECLARLYSPELEKAGKRCALAVIRSIFQTGNSDKIKACLDMRIPKHIIQFLQDDDSEVRHECLLIFLEISKGLQDEDFEIIGKSAANLKQELSKRAYRKTTFDQHKTLSLMTQQQDHIQNEEEKTDNDLSGTNKKRRGQPQQSQADMMSTYIKRTTALIEKNDNDKFINFALDLPNLNFLSNKRFLREMAICYESPVFIAPLIRLLKNPIENYSNKETILQIIANLFCGNEKVLISINSPACDTYMTLLKMLMQNSKMQNAKTNTSGLSAQMRNQLALQEKVVELFKYMFDQRRPTIIRDLSCIGSSSTLLKEQNIYIPNLINLPEIIAFVDEFNQIQNLTADMIIVDDFLNMLSDLRCWIKHFYAESAIPELTRIKALQRCISLIIKVVNIVWTDFPNQQEKRGEYLVLIKASLSLIDWLCVRGQEQFIFNEQHGKYNLEFIIDKCNFALSAFRQPIMNIRVPLEELTHNTKTNKEVQKARKYDMFPFTEIGTILQNIQYQLIRKNNDFINHLLSESDFGFVFGEQLILEYDFIRHCIDNKIESMVLIDTYVKKNEIRLNTFECLIKSNEHTLKSQLIKSNFIEKMFAEYVQDFREFNIQFSKIDLEFLAFRKTFPIRLECISIINSVLLYKERAPNVFTEIIMYARRHFLIRNEVAMIRQGKIGNEESTSLLLFSIILESNEEDLIYAMMQEGVHKTIRDLMKEYPSLNKRFPILAAFTNKF